MNTVCQENQCTGCMACIDKCPKGCISIADNLFAYNAVKDMSVCINCGQCNKICPNISKVEKKTPILWKQGWASSQIRLKSSSGGVASAIIQTFIESGGYVASCLFKKGEFVFELTNNKSVAEKFAGSKYVKSNPEGIFKKIQDKLKTDKVLFIGLPCQVAGLKNFIKKQDNLYTIDLICHGTPSPQLLSKFLQEKKVDINLCTNIEFRVKNQFPLRNADKQITPEGRDDYTMCFLNAVDYTENCYSCQYATSERISDITLGDSWGTDLTDEEKNGVSLILIQSAKGNELINAAGLTLHDVNIEKAKCANHQLKHPSIRKAERDLFLSSITKGNTFAYSTYKIYKKEVIKRNIKKILYNLHLMKQNRGGYSIVIYF